MGRKKVICLLVVIALLTGMQSLAIQAVKIKKSVSDSEVYSYIIKEGYDIVRNDCLIKMERTSYCLSLETLCSDGLELNIHVLLQNIRRKAYSVSINAEKNCIEEIYLTPKKHTIMQIDILHDSDDKSIKLHIVMMCMGTEDAKLFDIVVTMKEHFTEHSFQVSFLNNLMIRLLLFVVTIFGFYLYEGYFCISWTMYIIHWDMSFEDNIKQYSKISTSFIRAERKEYILQLLILADRMYLTLNGKWILKHCNIITYGANRSKKTGYSINSHLPEEGLNEATINKYIQEQENYNIMQKNLNSKEYEESFK